MAITVPTPGLGITVAGFGAPVANQLNSIEPTVWTALSFASGWSNYGSGTQVGQYRKVGDIVYVRGLIKGPGTAGVVATVPSGFRPPASIEFVCPYWDGTKRVISVISANPDGTLYQNDVVQASAGIAINSMLYSIT